VFVALGRAIDTSLDRFRATGDKPRLTSKWD